MLKTYIPKKSDLKFSNLIFLSDKNAQNVNKSNLLIFMSRCVEKSVFCKKQKNKKVKKKKEKKTVEQMLILNLVEILFSNVFCTWAAKDLRMLSLGIFTLNS